MPQSVLTFLLQVLLQKRPSRAVVCFWLGVSLAFAMLYSYLSLQQAFAGPFVVQDDARQHVFWMQRFLDGTLFPNDLIADYFQSVAPLGYASLYRLLALVGLDPLVACKILPVFLCAVVAVLEFFLFLEILPIPAASCTSALILLQGLWMTDDLGSGTPRAFFYPLFLGFLYALVRRSRWGCASLILLQGWFYPQTVLLSAAVLFLRGLRWKNGHLTVASRRDLGFIATGLGAAWVALLPFALATSAYGPTISPAEARLLPEFQPDGRSAFFHPNPWRYWLGGRSGFFPSAALTPATLAAAFLLPPLSIWRGRIPLLQALSRHWAIVPQLMLASVGLFGAAHLLLFRLHLPNRYSGYSARLILSWSAAIALFALLDLVVRWALARASWLRAAMAGIACLCLGIASIGYPLFLESFLDVGYLGANSAERQLHTFLAEQPSDSMTASLSEVTNNIATFAGRSVLFSPEHSIPYQTGYYSQIRQRARDVIRAQYSPDLEELQATVRRYGIDFWLLDSRAFAWEALADNEWLLQYQPEADRAIALLQRDDRLPRLRALQGRCTVYSNDRYTALSGACLLQER